ncbi:MAG: tRNA guanosine(34) transglycosylase Tgt [Xanthomonadaceae bacterium]|nr:tRNA guanosine(34) transglycosylase Tgt [Xanthomonadaceae bacterium]
MSRLGFKIKSQKMQKTSARAAWFQTLHNEVLTPLFMPVGTQATIKALRPEDAQKSGSQILLANTYHLMLRPGTEVFDHIGGIHKFMNWGKSVLTDSGGFQIFSLTHARRMSERGAEFVSQVDGHKILLTPEKSIAVQRSIGSDIMMVLDQCIASTSNREEAAEAMELTHRWAKRSLEAHGDSPQSMFGIVQGALFEDLRRESAEVLREMPFDGYAIGGLAVGETREEREHFTEFTTAFMPEDRPRYLMGVGKPIDLLEAVHRGVDMFDCILPTAQAQQGVAFTHQGVIKLSRGVYRLGSGPIDENCKCPTCATHSRAYIHHLIKSKEFYGWSLVANHNLYFYHELMREMRKQILAGTFYEYYVAKRLALVQDDEQNLPKLPLGAPRETASLSPVLLELGNFEVVKSDKGFFSVKCKTSGEIMHSTQHPDSEAHSIYAEQSRVRERVGETERLVVWDVGLGAGHNAIAVIRSLMGRSGTERNNPSLIISFEKDLDAMRLAAARSDLFPHMRELESVVQTLLDDHRWISRDGKIEWILLEGDFRHQFPKVASPDIIFYDPFSTHTDTELWKHEMFKRILSKTSDRECLLYTYTASTAVRGALLASGWYVGQGRATGARSHTTVAGNRAGFKSKWASDVQWLKREFIDQWSRSGSRNPEWDSEIKQHPQFQG